MALWTAVKGFLVGAATLVLVGSDTLGIQHGTVAKTIATVVLAYLVGDQTMKNDAAAKEVLRNGVDKR